MALFRQSQPGLLQLVVVLSCWQLKVFDLQYWTPSTEGPKARSLCLNENATTHDMSIKKQSHLVWNLSCLQCRQRTLQVGESADEDFAVVRIFIDGLSQRSSGQPHETHDCGFHSSSFIRIGPFQTLVANEAAAVTIHGVPCGCLARGNEAIRQAVFVRWYWNLRANG